jgi:hypothetical protein
MRKKIKTQKDALGDQLDLAKAQLELCRYCQIGQATDRLIP